MSRVRTFLASLALATSLVGCAVPHADANSARPPDAQMRIMPMKQSLRQQVRAKLVERRKQTIERFLAYREARVYPINSNVPGAAHVWLDELGNLCAAATLIAYDWGREASENVARENNNIALASLTEGELYNWILTSGMTQAEIVSIQAPGFMGRQDWAPEPVENPRLAEITRLYQLYTDVERQIRSLDKHNLDLAVDELMKHPQLARDLVAGTTASSGHFGLPSNVDDIGFEPGTPIAPPEANVGFAQPPPTTR